MSSEKEAGRILTSENAAEFYSQKLNLAVEPEPVAEVEQSTAEPDQEPKQSESEVKDEAQPTEERKQNPKLEKRFSEITKQREEARKEAQREREAREQLEARLKELEGKSAPKEAPKADEKPLPSQFTDAFEYAEALANWSAEQAIKNREKADAERKANEDRQKLITSWQSKLEQAKQEMPDYEDMVASSDVVVSDEIRDAILDSDVGPKILYHLAENPDVAQKLSGMSVRNALRELGKLEARMEATKEAPTRSEPVVPVSSKAPAPIVPISSGRSVGPMIDSEGRVTGSFAEYKAARRAGKIR
jgi:hypothetical protein